MNIKISDLIPEELWSQLLTLRRDLHRHPELSHEENRTAVRLEEALAGFGIESRRVAGTGVVAKIPGTGEGRPTIAVRGDIDALPIQEATGLDYASEVPGVMHACGHDVHATWAVGAAALLKENPAEGDVLIILQPAEEVGKGAKAIVETGALEEVSMIFGAHVDRRFEVGEVVAQEGPIAASTDEWEVELVGAGAHGARPHEGKDPIVGGSAVVSALQSVVARRVDPGHAGVVTVGEFHAGTAPNIIPDKVRLTGTLRALDPDVRQILRRELQRIVITTAAAFELEAELRYRSNLPPVVNAPEPTALARRAAAAVLGSEPRVHQGFLNMGGEDFAVYQETIPGCFLRIGAREPGSDVIPAHNPRFYAADEAIAVGAAVLAEAARLAAAPAA
jgi:hippurate hydrolase